MNIHVLLFAQVRLQAATSHIDLELSDGADVSAAVGALASQRPEIAPLLPSCMTAVGVDYVSADHVLQDGDELALIPPVQGG